MGPPHSTPTIGIRPAAGWAGTGGKSARSAASAITSRGHIDLIGDSPRATARLCQARAETPEHRFYSTFEGSAHRPDKHPRLRLSPSPAAANTRLTPPRARTWCAAGREGAHGPRDLPSGPE